MKDEKVILLIFMFVFLVSFVDARIFEENNKFYVEQELVEGWNLIAGISFSEKIHEKSQLNLDSIFSSYYYDSKNKRNVNIRPNYEAGNIEPLVLYANAFWVFSVKKGKIIYRVSPSFIDNNYLGGYYQFYEGENFIAINDKMYDKAIDELKGDCNIKKVYFYENTINNWTNISFDQKLNFKEKDLLTGKGINIVVKNDCKFMKLIKTENKKNDDEDFLDSVSRDLSSISFYLKTIDISKDLKELKFITQKLASRERIRMKVNNEIHYLGIIELKSNSAIIEIESNPVIIELSVGKNAKIDFNSDNSYDINIKLNEILTGKSDLTIEYISEIIPQDKINEGNLYRVENVEEKSDSDSISGEDDKNNSKLILIIIIIFFLLILVLLIFYGISKWREKLRIQAENKFNFYN